MKTGSGTLTLSGNNIPLTDGMSIEAGTVIAGNGNALGPGGNGNSVTVSSSASLAILGNATIGNVPITLNGTGTNGAGARKPARQ